MIDFVQFCGVEFLGESGYNKGMKQMRFASADSRKAGAH